MLFATATKIGIFFSGIENEEIIFIFFYHRIVTEKMTGKRALFQSLLTVVLLNVSATIHQNKKNKIEITTVNLGSKERVNKIMQKLLNGNSTNFVLIPLQTFAKKIERPRKSLL